MHLPQRWNRCATQIQMHIEFLQAFEAVSFPLLRFPATNQEVNNNWRVFSY
jgi:hypothetical protein